MEFFSNIDKVILRGISEDSRASVTQLARQAHCSRVTLVGHLREMEEKLGIVYTLEINDEMLGSVERHVIAVKFAEKPSAKFIDALFRNDTQAQTVFQTEGDFDLFIYARCGSAVRYIVWESHIATELSEFRPTVRPSEFIVAHTGYWPLNDSFVEEISGAVKVDAKDKELLVQLNKNSRSPIKKLSELTGMKSSTVRYRLARLIRSGIIKRFTIAAQKPPHQYAMVHLANYKYSKGFGERMLEIRRIYLGMDEKEFPLLNTLQIVAPISGSYRSFGLSLFDTEQDAVEGIIEPNRRVFRKDGIDIIRARITRVVKGKLPFRNIDVRKGYLIIEWY